MSECVTAVVGDVGQTLNKPNVGDSGGLLPGFDCSLDDLNATLTRVASDIAQWLDMLSSGPPEIEAKALHFDIKTGLIGEGAFGKVYKGTLNGTDVAIKIPNYQLDESSASELEDVRQEIRVLRKIFHPNIVLLLGADTNPGSIRIVFELMKASVKQLICEPKYKYNKAFDAPKKLKLIKDVAKGIAWLHSPSVKIIHRDLKLDNLMVDFNDTGKVCDFGLGVFKKAGKDTIRDTIKGNLLYRAPELMKHSRGQAREVEFTEMIDVYGFGILVWEIYRGEEWYPPHPFDEPSSYCDFVCDGKRPLLDNAGGVVWPSLLAELVRACWAQNPSERPSMEEVVQAVTGVEYQHWKATIAQQITSDVGRAFWLDNFTDSKITWVAMRSAIVRVTRTNTAAPPAPAASTSAASTSTKASSSSGSAGASLPSALGATAQQQQQRLASLRRVLCCDFALERTKQVPSDSVTIESFNVAQAAFGPFFVPDRAGAVLAQIEAIEVEPWFHGFITRQTAEERLKVTHRDLGTFLVRVSITQPDVPFVISYVGVTGKNNDAPAIHHLKISRPRWGEPTLVMDGVNFASLHECVAKGREHKKLLHACDTIVHLNPYDESM